MALFAAMLHYFKMRQELFDPHPAQDIYDKPGPGKGWPQECPPVRGANAFGFDLLANFDVTFIQSKGSWKVDPDITIESDFDYQPREESPGVPLSQQYAWFWAKGQTLPHPISDNVYDAIRNQVKVSTFLFLRTDPNDLLLMTGVPNVDRPWRAMSALIELDWYPASYPWHCVIELSRTEKKISIKKGEPLCRIIPVRRDTYFAQQMSGASFDDFFARGQNWLATHGRVEHESARDGSERGTVDITRTYVRQQLRPRFVVLP